MLMVLFMVFFWGGGGWGVLNLGVYFKKALFVPNISVYHKVGSHNLSLTESQVDLSWQFTLQRVWENLSQGDKGTI